MLMYRDERIKADSKHTHDHMDSPYSCIEKNEHAQ